MKSYYAIKSGSKYFAGWNKIGPRLRTKPNKDYIYEYKDIAQFKISNQRDISKGIYPEEYKFWKNAKVVKLAIVEI